MDNMGDIMQMLSGMLKNNGASSNETENVSKEETEFEMPDIETILKIKKLMDTMNSNDDSPIINLLISLKPFLDDSKKSIIDQIIKFIKLSSTITIFNEF